MSRILVFCKYLPSLTQQDLPLSATSYRSEQLVRPLIEAGHDLTIFTSGLFGRHRRIFERRRLDNVDYYETSYSHFDQSSLIADAIRGRSFDAVLAVSQIASNYALQFCQDFPLWCDLYGSVMGEAQAKCYREGSNQYLGHFLAMEYPVLQRADKFSTCGQWQEHMLCGELALMGRLNQENFGYRLVHGILPGVMDTKAQSLPEGPPHPLRGRLFPPNAHVVLWMGGYNTWTDIDTLFAGLEIAMSKDPQLHFLSIGGAIPGHDEKTYSRFQQMVRNSAHADRYLLQGWVPRKKIVHYLTSADLGLNIDAWHYETVFGTRTRLVEMLAYRLPVATSRGCELSYLLQHAGKAVLFDIGDGEGLADALNSYFARPISERREFARQCFHWALEELSFRKTTRPLQEWANNPLCAGDHNPAGRTPLMMPPSAFPQEPAPAPSLRHRATLYLKHHGWRATFKRSYYYVRGSVLKPTNGHTPHSTSTNANGHSIPT